MERDLSKTIVVLGMHRSGTSMIGGILNIIGINMGNIIETKSVHNPKGYFEDQNFLKINQQILKSAGGNWKNPPLEKSILTKKEEFKSKIKALIKDKPSIWGWKDPRTSLTIELYLPHLSNAYFIYCHRKPEAVADSLYRRYRMEIQKSIYLKKVYDERIENFFRKFKALNRLDLYYEEVLSNPQKFLNNIIEFLEIEVTKKEYQNAIKFFLPRNKLHKKSKRIKIKRTIQKNLRRPWTIPKLVLKIILSD